MGYTGLAAMALPYVGKAVKWMAVKAKGSPKTGDAVVALGAFVSSFGMSEDMRLALSNVFMFLAKALASV